MIPLFQNETAPASAPTALSRSMVLTVPQGAGVGHPGAAMPGAGSGDAARDPAQQAKDFAEHLDRPEADWSEGDRPEADRTEAVQTEAHRTEADRTDADRPEGDHIESNWPESDRLAAKDPDFAGTRAEPGFGAMAMPLFPFWALGTMGRPMSEPVPPVPGPSSGPAGPGEVKAVTAVAAPVTGESPVAAGPQPAVAKTDAAGAGPVSPVQPGKALQPAAPPAAAFDSRSAAQTAPIPTTQPGSNPQGPTLSAPVDFRPRSEDMAALTAPQPSPVFSPSPMAPPAASVSPSTEISPAVGGANAAGIRAAVASMPPAKTASEVSTVPTSPPVKAGLAGGGAAQAVGRVTTSESGTRPVEPIPVAALTATLPVGRSPGAADLVPLLQLPGLLPVAEPGAGAQARPAKTPASSELPENAAPENAAPPATPKTPAPGGSVFAPHWTMGRLAALALPSQPASIALASWAAPQPNPPAPGITTAISLVTGSEPVIAAVAPASGSLPSGGSLRLTRGFSLSLTLAIAEPAKPAVLPSAASLHLDPAVAPTARAAGAALQRPAAEPAARGIRAAVSPAPGSRTAAGASVAAAPVPASPEIALSKAGVFALQTASAPRGPANPPLPKITPVRSAAAATAMAIPFAPQPATAAVIVPPRSGASDSVSSSRADPVGITLGGIAQGNADLPPVASPVPGRGSAAAAATPDQQQTQRVRVAGSGRAEPWPATPAVERPAVGSTPPADDFSPPGLIYAAPVAPVLFPGLSRETAARKADLGSVSGLSAQPAASAAASPGGAMEKTPPAPAVSAEWSRPAEPPAAFDAAAAAAPANSPPVTAPTPPPPSAAALDLSARQQPPPPLPPPPASAAPAEWRVERSFAELAMAAASPAAALQQPLAGMAASVAVAQDAGGRIEVQLAPEELGRVRFELITSGDRMQIHLAVERPESLDLLRRHADQLLQEFRQAGIAGSGLSFGHWGQGEAQNGRPAPALSTTAPEIPPAADPLPTLAAQLRALPAGSGLNLRL